MFKVGNYITEDAKVMVFNVHTDLQVDDIDQVPVKTMRYPVENANLMQKFIKERKDWYIQHLNLDRDEARDRVMDEFHVFFSTENTPANINFDPTELESELPDTKDAKRRLEETFEFYRKIRDFPSKRLL